MLMVATAGLRAEDAAPTVGVSVDATFETKYLFRGLVLGEDAVHPSIELSYSDFYAGIWGNAALGKKDSYPDNQEWDFYAGKNFKVSDTTSLDAGFTYYYYPEVHSDNDTHEGYIGINWDVSGFTPAVYAYYDFTLDAFTLQGSVGTSVPLEELGSSLDLTASLGRVDGDGFDYVYWSVGASVPFKLSDSSTLTVGATFASNDLEGADDNNFSGSVGYSFSF